MECNPSYEIDSQLSTNSFVNEDYVTMSNAMIHTFLEKEDEEFDNKLIQSLGSDMKKLTEW